MEEAAYVLMHSLAEVVASLLVAKVTVSEVLVVVASMFPVWKLKIPRREEVCQVVFQRIDRSLESPELRHWA